MTGLGYAPRLVPIRRAVGQFSLTLVCVLLGGCGGTLSGAPEGGSTEGAKRICSPLTQPRPSARSPRRPPLDETFTVNLADVKGPNSGVRLRVTGATTFDSVQDQYDDAGTFATKGSFVAVAFTITNLGPEVVEPALNVNRLFGLTGVVRGTVISVDRVKGCGLVPPSYAKSVGLENPEIDMKPNQRVRTVAVYAVPATTGRMAWTAAALRVQVPLGRVTSTAAGR